MRQISYNLCNSCDLKSLKIFIPRYLPDHIVPWSHNQWTFGPCPWSAAGSPAARSVWVRAGAGPRQSGTASSPHTLHWQTVRWQSPVPRGMDMYNVSLVSKSIKYQDTKSNSYVCKNHAMLFFFSIPDNLTGFFFIEKGYTEQHDTT